MDASAHLGVNTMSNWYKLHIVVCITSSCWVPWYWLSMVSL